MKSIHPKIQAVLDELSSRATSAEDHAVSRAYHESWTLLREATHEIRMASIGKRHASQLRKIRRLQSAH